VLCNLGENRECLMVGTLCWFSLIRDLRKINYIEQNPDFPHTTKAQEHIARDGEILNLRDIVEEDKGRPITISGTFFGTTKLGHHVLRRWELQHTESRIRKNDREQS
jgi:hypothetical protein